MNRTIPCLAAAALAIVTAFGAAPVAAQQPASTGREVPARMVPVPDTVSPAMQGLIGAPFNPVWDQVPTTSDGWKALVAKSAANVVATLPEVRQRLGVSVTPTMLGGVRAFIVVPDTIPERNRNRLLVHVHGGAYVLFPGEAATKEAILMAGYGGMKVISVDYRMPPDNPYPAALDDAMAVWRAAIGMAQPRNMAIFGTSTGGGMTLAMVLRARQEGLPLPAAIAPGTPWSDMTKTGDTYFTNDHVDNIVVSNDGFLGAAALLYANGHDLKDPMLSPVYGDLHGFPPTILTSGTRDLFLSNTVRVHRKLREAGVDAVLQVFEGQSHAQYARDPFAPETKEAFEEIARFFDAHLGQ